MMFLNGADSHSRYEKKEKELRLNMQIRVSRYRQNMSQCTYASKYCDFNMISVKTNKEVLM